MKECVRLEQRTEDILLERVYSMFQLPFDFLFCDETTLKTMIRANPGIIILNKGTVTQKKNWIDIEDLEL